MADATRTPDNRASDARTPDPRAVMVTPSRGIVGTAIQVVLFLLLLSILAGVVFMLFTVAALVNAPGQVAGGVSSQVSGVAAQASRVASSAQQALQNATDPNHPPTGLSYDNELSAIDVWRPRDGLPGGSQYVLTIQAIKRRDGADSPDTALYAVVHAELRQPHETRLLGQLLRSDSDPHDYVLYKGETFRVSRAVYRVNWISQEENAIAAGVLRHPDTLTGPLKFDYD